MTALKVAGVDGAVHVVLPPEVARRLKVKAGDTVYAVHTVSGVELTADAEFAAQMESARALIDEDREALEKLAK